MEKRTKLKLKEEEDEELPAQPASHKGGLHMTTSPLLYHTAGTPQSEINTELSFLVYMYPNVN